MPTILIAGGTGLIGSRLSVMLREKGYEVLHLSRTADLKAAFPAYRWNLESEEIDQEAVRRADFVINLAGAGIADKRWTAARKRLIIDSRVNSAALLLRAFQELDHWPEAYISSAATGFYGDRGEEWLTEESSPGAGFLSESCMAWEEAIRQLMKTEMRVAALRIGIVLSTQGGAMEKMMLPITFFSGTYFGDGVQYYSWIHIDDLCRMFVWAVENKNAQGFYNAVSPDPVSNKALTQSLAKAMQKPAVFVPVPAAALRLAMGEMADVVLYGARVSSQKIEKAGFDFQFPQLNAALKDLIERGV